MEVSLSDFVEETLVAIQTGVTAATKRGVHIPQFSKARLDVITEGYSQRQKVEFDIAVTVTSESKKGDKAGVGVKVLSAIIGGVEASSEAANGAEHITRLKFTVPITLYAVENNRAVD